MASTTSPQPTAVEHFDNLAATYEASTGGCTRELAQHLIPLLPALTPSSTILDNACGNGIVTQEILLAHPSTTFSITLADGAATMIEFARRAVASIANKAKTLDFNAMPGEALTFPDNHFTHSITNQGILFFKDGSLGARQIHRTLAPGGTAVVTSWSYLGYMPVIHAAQASIRPGDEPFRIPISADWLKPEHLENVLREAGFEDVKMSEKKVWYAARDASVMAQYFSKLFAPMMAGWGDEEKKGMLEALEREAGKKVEKVVRVVDGQEVEMVGLEMMAIIAVARK